MNHLLRPWTSSPVGLTIFYGIKFEVASHRLGQREEWDSQSIFL